MRGIVVIASLALGLSSCLGTTNQHLASLDSSVKSVSGNVNESLPRLTQDADTIASNIEILNQSLARMAESLAQLQLMAGEIAKVILEGTMVAPNPPAEAPTLDLVLKSPQPSPSPSEETP